jgi:hypothetical protein
MAGDVILVSPKSKSNILILFLGISIILIAVALGVIIQKKYYSQDTQDTQHIKYSIVNNSLHYNVLYSIDMPNYTIPIQVNVNTSSHEGDISLKITTVTDNEYKSLNVVNTTHNVTINNNGKIIALEPSEIIPEVWPEYPVNVILQDKSIKKGDAWTVPINEKRAYNLSRYIINYTIIGENNYKCTDFDNVTINNNTFYCAVINANLNYNVNMISRDNQSDVYTSIIYKSQSTNWINVENGVIIKIKNNIAEKSSYNLSEPYKNAGISTGNVLQTISTKEQTLWELQQEG